MKFIRKPVEIEAVQWTGENDREVLGLTGRGANFVGRENALQVHAKGGLVTAAIGDWIVRENGRLHVFSDAEFRQMFVPSPAALEKP